MRKIGALVAGFLTASCASGVEQTVAYEPILADYPHMIICTEDSAGKTVYIYELDQITYTPNNPDGPYLRFSHRENNLGAGQGAWKKATFQFFLGGDWSKFRADRRELYDTDCYDRDARRYKSLNELINDEQAYKTWIPFN